MALSERDKERINLMNPVANDVKLGDILQEAGGGGAQGPKGDKGDKGDPGPKGDKGDTGPAGKDGFPTKQQWDELVARVDALEGGS